MVVHCVTLSHDILCMFSILYYRVHVAFSGQSDCRHCDSTCALTSYTLLILIMLLC